MIGFNELQEIQTFSWNCIKKYLKDTPLSDEEWEKFIAESQEMNLKYRYGDCGQPISMLLMSVMDIVENKDRRLNHFQPLTLTLEEERQQIMSLLQFGWKMFKGFATANEPMTEEAWGNLFKLSAEFPVISSDFDKEVMRYVVACLEIVEGRQTLLEQNVKVIEFEQFVTAFKQNLKRAC